MREKGKVVELSGRFAKVSIEPGDACKDCPACSFCKATGSKRVIEVENEIGARLDDFVYIEISSRGGFYAVFLLFGLPVILGLIGLLLGSEYGDLYSAILGVGGFIIGLICAKITNDILRKKQKLLPRIISVISTNESVSAQHEK